MLVDPKSASLTKHRILSALLATQWICLQASQTWAQAELNIQAPSNFVSGEGLSPSYFLPPSTLPLAQPPVESLPTVPAPALIGSGLPLVTPEPVKQVPVPLNIPIPNSEPVPPTPSIANSVDLDLRTPSSQVATGNYSHGSNRPLGSPSPWFFGANALLLNLKDQDDRVFTSSALDPSVGLLRSSDVRMPSTGGYELGIGRYFGCGKYALSATYWGLSPVESIATVNSANTGPLATSLPLNVPSLVVPGVTEGLFVVTTALSD
ncbi:MAG: hypothetical protein ACKOOI_16500, partial [Pirellula sp.]